MLLHFLVQHVKEVTDFLVKRVLCHLVVARVMSQFLEKKLFVFMETVLLALTIW
jgi:hypothetical protein